MKNNNKKNIITICFTILCVSIICIKVFANTSTVGANYVSPQSSSVWPNYASPQSSSVWSNYASPQPSSVWSNYASPQPSSVWANYASPQPSSVWANYASPQPSSVWPNYASPQPSSVWANYVSPYSYNNNGFYNYGGTQNFGGIGGTSAYFMIVNYDRIPYQIYNGEPMITRYPIIGGVNPNMVAIANGLIPNAYRSIENWCRNYLTGKNYQEFFLNYASIENQTDVNITMIVHCALKKNAIIDGNMEFRLKLDLLNNRYNWERIDDTINRKKIQIYDKDSIVIIE